MGIDTPTMNRNDGKTRSVAVQPSQGACFSGSYTACHDPGLLTRIIPASVIPRKASSESSRPALGGFGCSKASLIEVPHSAKETRWHQTRRFQGFDDPATWSELQAGTP